MIRMRTLMFVSLGLWLSGPVLDAQTLDRYRNVQLGSGVAAVAVANGLTSADGKVIHERPATIYELEWRSALSLGGTEAAGDPVRGITFSFYNDQLFRIVVNYDRERTEGLTDADLIAAIAATYGPPMTSTAAKLRASEAGANLDQATAIARWENGDASITLLRARYPTPVSLLVVSQRLDKLARVASAEAIRLDVLEGPRREVDRKKQEAEALRLADEKARPANKAAFRP